MPDFAPHYTARYRVTYSVQGAEHTMQFRWARGAPINTTDMAGRVKAVLDGLASLRFTDWSVLGADFAAQDSTIFLPTTAPAAIAGTASITGRADAQKAKFVQFLGRSQAGGRGGFFIYGVNLKVESDTFSEEDFRVTSAESALIATTVSTLTTGSPTFAANDGNGIIWKPYANVKFNDYWVRRVRG